MDGILLQLPALDSTTRWWLVVAGALTIFYAVMRPMRKRKDPLGRTIAPATPSARQAVEHDMNELLVELSEMARQTTAQLDTRALKLELLIKQADERIATLRAAGRLAAAAEQIPPARHAEIPPPAIHDPRHIEIYVLADQGLTASTIASRLNRPFGEVELILALRHRAASV